MTQKLNTWDRISRDLISNQGDSATAIKLVYELWVYASDQELPGDLSDIRRREGLCVFLSIALIHAEYSPDRVSAVERYHTKLLARELKAGLYPFGFTNFEQRTSDATQDLDPARIQWVNRVLSGEVE